MSLEFKFKGPNNVFVSLAQLIETTHKNMQGLRFESDHHKKKGPNNLTVDKNIFKDCFSRLIF